MQSIKIPRELLKEILEDEIELYNLFCSNYEFSSKLEKLKIEYNKRIDQIRWLLRVEEGV